MLNQILQLGIQWILALQSLGNWVAGPMQFFTFLGNENFFIFVAPAFFWCYDAGLGIRLGLLIITSANLNSAFKLAFTGPRPFWIDLRVKVLASETTFGLPSGHAQNAVAMWGFLAAQVRKGWFWLLALLLSFMIGLSRVYNGVHFPSDVLVGWLLGALILLAFIVFEKPVREWLQKHNPFQQTLVAMAASLLLILINALILFSLGNWTIPSEWLAVAAQTSPGLPPNPLDLSGVISTAGIFFGLSVGWIWLRDRGGFDAGGPIIQRAIRFLIGLIGVAIFWQGLGMVLPHGEAFVPFVLRYLRYALVGIWVTGLAPYIFIRLKLAEQAKSGVPPQNFPETQ
jgi:membrane-associated phospholipid phosphatase